MRIVRAALLAVVALMLASALVAGAHDCSSPGDCEQTAGYNAVVAVSGGLAAIIAGLLGTQLGGATTVIAGQSGTTVSTGAGPTGPGGPLIDPGSGEPIIEWRPGAFGPDPSGNPGRPGDVWWGGKWTPRSEMPALLDAARQDEAIRQQLHQQFEEFHERTMRDYAVERQQRLAEEAAARAQREAQARAAQTLNAIRQVAIQRGDDEMWERSMNVEYGPHGELDLDKINRMKIVMENRVIRGYGEPEEPQSHWVVQGMKDTFNDARHSVLIRVGTGVLTGGSSEVYYLSQTAYDAMDAESQRAIAEGRDFGYTDALRSGGKAVGEQVLPVNTIKAIAEGRGATDQLLGFIADVGTVVGHVDTARNLSASLQAYRNGAGGLQVLTARGSALGQLGGGEDPGAWPGGEPPPGGPRVSPRDVPEGGAVAPESAGMSEAAARHQQWVSDVENVTIETRVRSPGALDRIKQGDIPKSVDIKAKTINPLDVELGAPAEHLDRVAYFEPKMPSLIGRSPEEIVDIQKRFIERRNEFRDLATKMEDLTDLGTGKVDVTAGGVLRDRATGQYITGDLDIGAIRDRTTGALVSAEKEAQVLQRLGAGTPFDAQHGGLLHWQPQNSFEQGIYDRLTDGMRPPTPLEGPPSLHRMLLPKTGSPLVVTSPGGSQLRVGYYHGEPGGAL